MQLIYIHVPKTAGATFRSILKKQYAKRGVFIIHDMFPEVSIAYLNKLSDVKMKQYCAIAGHGAHHLVHRDYQKRVIHLREPLDHFLSGFFHIKRSVHNKYHQLLKEVRTVRDYMNFCSENDCFNKQVQYLSQNYESFTQGTQNLLSPEKQLEQAKKVLDYCDYVFLTDQFVESLLILKDEFNWKTPNFISKNVTKDFQRQEISSEVRNFLLDKLDLDYKLYEYAKTKQEKLFNPDEIEIKVRSFLKSNQRYNSFVGPILSTISKMNFLLERMGMFTPAWKKRPTY